MGKLLLPLFVFLFSTAAFAVPIHGPSVGVYGGASGGGAPTTAQYLVGAADATLSAEIVITDSASLATHLGDTLGTGFFLRSTSPTITTPLISGVLDLDGGAVNDDDCTGQQGLMWYDDTDNAIEFCPGNSGVPMSFTQTANGTQVVTLECAENAATGECYADDEHNTNAPGNPASGSTRSYRNSNGVLVWRDSAGVEVTPGEEVDDGADGIVDSQTKVVSNLPTLTVGAQCTDSFNTGGPPQTSGSPDGKCDSDGATLTKGSVVATCDSSVHDCDRTEEGEDTFSSGNPAAGEFKRRVDPDTGLVYRRDTNGAEGSDTRRTIVWHSSVSTSSYTVGQCMVLTNGSNGQAPGSCTSSFQFNFPFTDGPNLYEAPVCYNWSSSAATNWEASESFTWELREVTSAGTVNAALATWTFDNTIADTQGHSNLLDTAGTVYQGTETTGAIRIRIGAKTALEDNENVHVVCTMSYR